MARTQTDGTKATMHGYYITLNNGEMVRTCTKYKIGQRLIRDEIDEN